jgi:hypothetical protein
VCARRASLTTSMQQRYGSCLCLEIIMGERGVQARSV